MKKYYHAYIIAGPSEETEKKALSLCAGMLCEEKGDTPCGSCRSCRKIANYCHPDVEFIDRLEEKGKLKQGIGVEQIRDIVIHSRILPTEADTRVYIFREGGLMNPAAQNAFLKLLEEPPAFCAFIICAERAGQLLETVRSRCVLESINEETSAPDEAISLAQEYIKAASSGNEAVLLRFCNRLSEEKGEALKDFSLALKLVLTDIISGKNKALPIGSALKMLKLTEELDKFLACNVSPKHIGGYLAVKTLE